MRKIIPYILKGTIIITVLSLVLTIVFELLRLLDIAGVCFIIFLIFGAVIICMAVAFAFTVLSKQIKAKGPKKALIPLLKRFFIWSLALLILELIFQHKLRVLEVVLGSAALSLTSVINFEKPGPDDNDDPPE